MLFQKNIRVNRKNYEKAKNSKKLRGIIEMTRTIFNDWWTDKNNEQFKKYNTLEYDRIK